MFNLGLCHKLVLVGPWGASPNNFNNNNANVRNVNTTGDNNNNNVNNSNGARGVFSKYRIIY